MHLLRMMVEKERMVVVFSWICIVVMCLEESLKRSMGLKGGSVDSFEANE